MSSIPSTPQSTATTIFQLNVPRILEPIAPALAALHVRRSRALPETCDSLALTHCASCGTFLLDGTGSVRVVRHARSKRRPKKEGASSRPGRMMRMSCSICGHEQNAPIEETMARVRSSFPGKNAPTITPKTSSEPSKTPSVPVLKDGICPPQISKQSLSSCLPSAQPTPLQGGNAQVRAKSRPKKASGLQDMLARNKQREEQERKKQGGTGLSAFLEGL
ncbi:hypothetical protein BXZ70DRAFT_398318 [Cristinia sonorae]|uniref:Uncharacterized protein n=1 Tax=Cristinia sonorae TaxID=1940300 RepID=A0A8K0XTG1_9AGAR|nr:hypothetical protein BXZ70DRAFT_398318 [Cristinia sonorae]